jgi:hypothetical protein
MYQVPVLPGRLLLPELVSGAPGFLELRRELVQGRRCFWRATASMLSNRSRDRFLMPRLRRENRLLSPRAIPAFHEHVEVVVVRLV